MKRSSGLKRKTRLRKESPKRAGERALYMVKREKFLKANPLCQACFEVAAVDVHHVHGRLGENYLNEKTWLAVCRTCHERIHTNPSWARDNNLLA